jgi:GH15 family glucan-1,4-alpha-glucosidase
MTHPGSRELVVLFAAANKPLILPPLAAVDQRIDRSDAAWREWLGNLSVNGPYVSEVSRSALALKRLMCAPTGAIAAEGTSWLPECIGGDKFNHQRFAWTRNVAFTIDAFLRVGATEEAKAAFTSLTATLQRHGSQARTMFGLDGQRSSDEEMLNLSGYAKSTPRSGESSGALLAARLGARRMATHSNAPMYLQLNGHIGASIGKSCRCRPHTCSTSRVCR